MIQNQHLLLRCRDRLLQLEAETPEPLIDDLSVALGEIEPSMAPLSGVARVWRKTLQRRLRAETRKRDDASANLERVVERDRERFGRDADVQVESTEIARIYRRERDASGALIEAVGRILLTLDAGIPALRNLLLPIGTTVRITSRTAGDEVRAADGSIGVVVGYRFDSELPLCIAYGDQVLDNYGHSHDYDDERPFRSWHALSEIDVIEPARFVDGSTNESLWFVPTHVQSDGKEDSAVMLVHACGRVWRTQMISGAPANLGAEDAESDFTWLVRNPDHHVQGDPS